MNLVVDVCRGGVIALRPMRFAETLRTWFANYLSGGDAAEWHSHALPSFSSVTALDGSKLSGTVMRRRIGGEWQYRKMTEQEAAQDWQSQQI